MKNLLNQIRANATLMIMAKGNIQSVDIDKIPEHWENFNNTQDKWIEVKMPENQQSTACIYIGKKGSIFPPHFHKKNVEHFMILNPTGKIKVITTTQIKEVSFPNAVLFKKAEKHAVEFLEDTKLFIVWHPKFTKGWNAEFLNEEK